MNSPGTLTREIPNHTIEQRFTSAMANPDFVSDVNKVVFSDQGLQLDDELGERSVDVFTVFGSANLSEERSEHIVKALQKLPQAKQLLLSGGIPPYDDLSLEPISEAQQMLDYLKQSGFDHAALSSVLLEEKSRHTKENIAYVLPLWEELSDPTNHTGGIAPEILIAYQRYASGRLVATVNQVFRQREDFSCLTQQQLSYLFVDLPQDESGLLATPSTWHTEVNRATQLALSELKKSFCFSDFFETGRSQDICYDPAIIATQKKLANNFYRHLHPSENI